MFTGLVEELGKVAAIKPSKLVISAQKITEGLALGDSVAVNGVCLTVSALCGAAFAADVMPETLLRSGLAGLKAGDQVNLERAMLAGGRFGGHLVSGHIDGVGTITAITKDDNARWLTVQAQPQILHYMVEKGSVAIDGISLTVAYVDETCFKVSVIPHTRQQTTLAFRKIGDQVNLECDLVAKYLEKFLAKPNHSTKSESRIDEKFLIKYGF